MQTQLLPAHGAIPLAASLLAAGNLVAFPTETVYGLGADARADAAVGKIYQAKGRPAGNPIIVHVAEAADARAYAGAWPDAATRLAQRFWPGPLTLILPRGPRLSPLVSAGRSTVALRVPNHPVAQSLLRLFNGPIAAPSANRSGLISPTSAAHVYAELAGRIPLIIDGGDQPEDCRVGLESTVLDLSGQNGEIPRILRPGAITASEIRAVIGDVLLISQVVDASESALSPGQHSRHYAPRTPAFRFSRTAQAAMQSTASRQQRVVLLTHDPAVRLPYPHDVMLLPADAAGYARVLYASLRQADALGASSIMILMPDTMEGLWAAVVDRLQRAAVLLPIM